MDQPAIAVTVMMATHNGASTLPRVLEAYRLLIAPPGGWRLVAVDNASTDTTLDLLWELAGNLPMIPLRIERQGKNAALNAGLAHTAGELIVFTDDDVLPDRDWLVALSQAALQSPEYDVFAGTIYPVWPKPPPDWILRLVNLGATYAITPASLTSGPVASGLVWGANMAIRRRILAAGYRFNEAVGPQAGEYAMGSEVDLVSRLEKAGHRALFVPQARVGHLIRPHQLEREWIVRRAFRLGRHMYHRESEGYPAGTKLIRGAPRWQYRRLLNAYLASLAGRLRGDFDTRLRADWDVSYLRGYLLEAHRTRMTRP